MSNRRQFLGAGLGAMLTLPPCARGIAPLTRHGQCPLRLSLAAYSLRDQLPNYRGNTSPGTAPMDMAGFLRYCAQLGLDGAEVTSYYLPDPCPRSWLTQLKRLALGEGLVISGGAIGNNFALEGATEIAAQFDYTQRWLEAYALLGAPVVRVFAGKPTSTADPQGTEQRIIEHLHKACARAGEFGIVLALENHDFTTDIGRFLRIVRAVESPWFGANVDTGNLVAPTDAYAELATVIPYAVNVQIKAKIPQQKGTADADYDRLVALLQRGNYRGFVVLEYEEEEPLTAIPAHLQRLRRALASQADS